MAGKIILWIALYAACSAAVAGNNISDVQQPQLVERYRLPDDPWPEIMYFPGKDGEDIPVRIYGKGYFHPATKDDVSFVLYTRQVSGKYFKPQENNINVITVDWSKIAASPCCYAAVKEQTVHVGGVVAKFVHFLKKYRGLHRRDVHLIGHSLGAHVMGIAAKRINERESGKVSRVTGLDPAGPLFKLSDPSTRLDRKDAHFVDVIHTSIGQLGFTYPIGKVDFFPNGGLPWQPGCLVSGEIACSHSRAWEFYAESINSRNFLSLPCKSYLEFKLFKHRCNSHLAAPMGEAAPPSISGNYYLYTSRSPPFALG